MPDISDTLKADSTQLNAVDFGGQSRTYTVTSVRVVAGEQPVNIRLAEDVDGREYRPSKSMRRVLSAIWGPDSDAWIGRRFTLYTDPSVQWGGKEVGGIKISHASHIDGPTKVMLQESSTVRRPHIVEPLTEAPKPVAPTDVEIAASTDRDQLREWWQAHPRLRAQIETRSGELNAPTPPPAEDASSNAQWDQPQIGGQP